MKKMMVIILCLCLAAFMLIGCTPVATPTPALTPTPVPTVEATVTPDIEPTPSPTEEATEAPDLEPTPMPAGTFDQATGVYTASAGTFTVTAPAKWSFSDASTAQQEIAMFSLTDAANNNALLAYININKIYMSQANDMKTYKSQVLPYINTFFAPDWSEESTSDKTVSGQAAIYYEGSGTNSTLSVKSKYYVTYIPYQSWLFAVTMSVPADSKVTYDDVYKALVDSFKIK